MKEKRDTFKNIKSIFGINVFDNKTMKEKISKEGYAEFMKVINDGKDLSSELADEIANAMKDWAIEQGATHYTHWFQPLNENTAEKHDSFIDLDENGDVILKFSGKNLIKGEADASSFPSGGTRATFEARGYTVWDCTSPAFVKHIKNGSTVLCIPTAFCSYRGEALDKKTPLLRALQSLNTEAMRVLRLLGNKTSKRVDVNLGAEQEYFLIKKEDYNKRMDLLLTGRTLFGAKSPKGQEMDDQYYASIRDCVSAFMNELNYELWELGITAKTQHNEAAPSQHELAPIFATANIATDHNQLIMEMMKKVADRNGLACILHEKPFKGVNGSGKHNNWSMTTDDGINLLKPGKTPRQNKLFLTFFTAVISAVDEYAYLLRLSASHPGNEHRLGEKEAPPAIISIFVGDMLQEVLEKIAKDEDSEDKQKQYLNVGVNTLPKLPQDLSDRNRTSPFAFTGNKFEFRMVGSSASTATPNVILCTIVAEILSRFADRLENAKDKEKELANILSENIKEHKRILFSGNSYSKEWVEEAKKRGLLNIDNCLDAYGYLTKEESVKLFEKHKVLSKLELTSREEIYYENYAKTIDIEAKTMLLIAKTQIVPAVIKYSNRVANSINNISNAISVKPKAQTEILKNLVSRLDRVSENIEKLEKLESGAIKIAAMKERAFYYRDNVVGLMEEIRQDVDYLETITDKRYWPLPSYADILFYD